MPDEAAHQYLFVAIDRASRWVYVEILPEKTAANARDFLRRLIEKAPFTIEKILTDNGKEFTDRFCATGEREPTGRHLFDQGCAHHGIEHRLIAPRHPQTNGMVERFNGRIAEVLATTRFDSAQNLADTLTGYVRLYNHQIPQKAIGHIAPIQALKDWQQKCPERFKKRVYNLTGLDNYGKTAKIILPHKTPRKSKKNPSPTLTEEQKKANKAHSQKRVAVEHAIGGMKHFHCLTHRVRNQSVSFIDQFLGLGAGLWNFKIA